MSRSAGRPWHVPESVSETLRRAVEQSVDPSLVADVLAASEYEDLERRRVEAVVSAAMDRVEDRGPAGADRRSATDERPRSSPARHVDLGDVEYLTDDEFARLLGVALSRFGGSTVRPEVRDCAVDLFWNRSHDTVGVRTVVRPDGGTVREQTVAAVATGETTPAQGRAPSEVVVATNGTFSDEAVAVADANGIGLYDGAHVARWLSEAKVGQSLAGEVLERGGRPEFDVERRLEDAPTPPATVREFDPLEASPAVGRPSAGSSPEQDRATATATGEAGTPADDARPDPGELGRLYADPSEDGDFGAFERFADRLDDVSEDD